MATETEMTPARGPGRGQAPVLVTRLGGQQRIFPAGAAVRVGRDPALELVSVNPMVSRDTHGVITSDPGGATYVDQSRRGTFLDGKRLTGPLRITESVVLRLGDPATGEELGITPPLTSTQIAHNHGRKVLGGRMRRGALAGVALAAVAGLATYGFFALRPASGGLSGGLPPSVLKHAEAATVRLLNGTRETATYSGSGTVISPTGLILTNSHVAAPSAPGMMVGSSGEVSGPNPSFLTVQMTTGPSSPVVDKYRARTVAADGYLDLAVIQIYATASGKPINPASLHLPYLTIGNVAALQLDQNLTTLGFPGMSQSDSITVTSGVVDTFVPDPLKHVKDPRFELETTAKIGHGNSGGGAITDSGQLVGVPSLGVPGTGTDVSWRLRSIAEAKPLIAAARNHTAYHSTILVQRTGSESVTSSGVGATADAACAGGQTLASSASAVFGFNYSGFPSGLDYMAVIVAPDGTALRDEHQNPPQGTTTTNSGCLSFTVPAALYNQDTIPVGTYQIQLLVGPSLTPAGPAVAVHITAPAGGGSSNGAGN